MTTLVLTALLALAAKNLVEMLKHFANVGGIEDGTYTPRKGMYALLAPTMLTLISVLAENQGVVLDLLGQLGVDTGSGTLSAAIMTGIIAGLAAPDAYDLQGLLKTKVKTNQATYEAIEASVAGG